MVISGPAFQSMHFFLLIGTLPCFNLTIITSHEVPCSHFTILWGNFIGAEGIDTQTEEEEGAATDSSHPATAQHLRTNGFEG